MNNKYMTIVFRKALFFWMFTRSLSLNKFEYLDKFCKQQISEDYESHLAPVNEANPGQSLNVYVKFKVIDIDEINEGNMDFRLHMYFKTFWNDTRLKRKKEVVADCSSYVWTPDVLFETAKYIQTFETVSTSFRIQNSGLIIMENRYAFKASCWMDFKYYPFDIQNCLFTVVFMTTFDSVAQLKWFDDESSPYKGKAIEFSRNIEPPKYHLNDPTTHSLTKRLTYANYTYLIANFTLVRRLTGSVVSIFLPSSLVVAVSWVTFWLRPEAAPARVSLSITSLLTLCTQVHQYKSQLTPVNYITAMDIWLFVCIFVVFCSLLEFAICYNAYVGRKEVINEQINKDEESEKCLSEQPEDKTNPWSGRKWKYKIRRNRERNEGLWKILNSLSISLNDCQKLDRFCRTYFPIFFFCFAIVYWTYYLNVSI